MERDLPKAIKQYRQAAEQGYPLSQLVLGMLYARGDGVPKDLVEAYAWWSLAGAANQEAERFRAALVNELSPDQIYQASKRTRELRTKVTVRPISDSPFAIQP